MATTASSASNSASRFSIESSVSRSRHGDSSPWMMAAPSLDDPLATPSLSDMDNADKKPVWNKPSNRSSEVSPLLGAAESWPALSLSARPSSNKSPSFDSHPGSMQTALNATSNASADSTAAATSSQNHSSVRKPFRRNNNGTTTSSSTTNIPNATPAAPFNTRDHHIHPQRASGTFRHSQRNRNTTSYPRADGHRRSFDHGNQTCFSHRNYGGRGMPLQPQRGLGIMRPQMLMGPPSFPASSAQYMAAPQFGGPMLYPDYAQHVFMPHPPPEPIALVGPFPPLPLYYPSFDAMLYSKILTQVEYYFSADNLSRDEHLRDQMNDQGWVPVRVIAGFRRLAELTNNIQTILEALRNSQVVEIKGETLRRRGDWDKYLLPREPSKSGPAAEGSNNAALVSQLESMTLSEGSREGE